MMDLNLLLQQMLEWIVRGTLILLLLALLAVFGYMFFQWLKHRRRENYALNFVTLLVRLPRDNEIKIDAAEQMFTGLMNCSGPDFLSE